MLVSVYVSVIIPSMLRDFPVRVFVDDRSLVCTQLVSLQAYYSLAIPFVDFYLNFSACHIL